MKQKTERLYPTLNTDQDLERRLEKKQIILTVLITISTTLKN